MAKTMPGAKREYYKVFCDYGRSYYNIQTVETPFVKGLLRIVELGHWGTKCQMWNAKHRSSFPLWLAKISNFVALISY